MSYINSHLSLVYLIYFVSFLVLGLTIHLKVENPRVPNLDDPIRFLKYFAFLHSYNEAISWYNINYEQVYALSLSGDIVLLVSFIALMEYGRRLILSASPVSVNNSFLQKVLLGLPITIGLTLATLIASLFTSGYQNGLANLPRYFLGFPSSLMVAYGLFYISAHEAKFIKLGMTNTIRFAAFCFAAYAFLAGLVIKGGANFPGYLPNVESFLNIFGIPVQFLRSLVALGLALAYSRIIVAINIETRKDTSVFDLSFAAKTANLAYWQYDVISHQFILNDQFYEMLKTSAEQAGGFRMSLEDYESRFVYQDDAGLVGRDIQMLIESSDPHKTSEIELRLIRADGEVRWIFIRIMATRNAHGTIIGLRGINLDITERKQNEEMIWKQANFDSLTGLPNRNMFRDRLEQEMLKSQRSGLPLAIHMIDLDKFKEVNDTLGHDQGDILLKETARRITDCVRTTDSVARLGGDEFIVVLSQLADINNSETIAQEIINRLAEPFKLGDEIAHVSASIGITLFPTDASDIESLLKNADQAMYLSKSMGRNRFSYFTPALQETAQKRLKLTNELRGALAANQFQVYYQPIVELATGSIHKAEALVRWNHPEHGLVSPMEFIPLVEESGLIIPIGDWVFKEAVAQVEQWRSKYHGAFQISVNISPVQIRRDDIAHISWPEYLMQQGIPGQSITIEITEDLLLNADPVINKKLLYFRDSGIQISIDDFGTGSSSLSYLKKFDIDYLKIGRSFVNNLETDASNQAFCKAIIVMAHELGFKVIAEGIETKEQRQVLADAGCDYSQGYLFSKPVPPEEFEKLLVV